jgi:hypothetical protein
MRFIRVVIAVLLAVSLAILPVSSAMAAMHAGNPEMSMSAPDSDCACCNAAHKCATDICTLKCYNSAALYVEGQLLVGPLPQPLIDMASPAMSPFSQRPDPPPPRS